jgi:hypothetical protein
MQHTQFVIVAATALAIAGATFLYAEQLRFDNTRLSPSDRDEGQVWQRVSEDLNEFHEIRLVALREGLNLTPEQAKYWPAFEQAARDFGKRWMERRIAMRGALPSDDAVEHMRQRVTVMSETAAALKKLADATEPLYKSLDDNQKQRFRHTQSLDRDVTAVRMGPPDPPLMHDRMYSLGESARQHCRHGHFGSLPYHCFYCRPGLDPQAMNLILF